MRKTYIILLVLFVISWAASYLWPEIPYSLSQVLLNWKDAPPFGTDAFGRNLGILTLFAAVQSIGMSTSITVLLFATTLLLTPWIAIAPSFLRKVIHQVLQFFLSFPALLITLAFAAAQGPSQSTLVFSIFMGTLPGLLRFFSLRLQEVNNEDFVASAVALGASPVHIQFRYLTPSAFELVWVKFPQTLKDVLISEATLSFLGIGAAPGITTWGSLILQGKDYILEAPHIILVSSLSFIFFIILLLRLSERLLNRV